MSQFLGDIEGRRGFGLKSKGRGEAGEGGEWSDGGRTSRMFSMVLSKISSLQTSIYVSVQ